VTLAVIGDSLARAIIWDLMKTWPEAATLPEARHLSMGGRLPLFPLRGGSQTAESLANHTPIFVSDLPSLSPTRRRAVAQCVLPDDLKQNLSNHRHNLATPDAFAAANDGSSGPAVDSWFAASLRWDPVPNTVREHPLRPLAPKRRSPPEGKPPPAPALPPVTVVSRGMWDAMNLGHPPTQLLLGAALTVRDFFTRAAAAAAAAAAASSPTNTTAAEGLHSNAPSPPLLVYYVMHCASLADPPKIFRRRVSMRAVTEPFRRAAACGVAGELRRLAAVTPGGWGMLEAVGRVSVFDACGAIQDAPRGTTTDAMHVSDPARAPLVDDLLGRYVCPGTPGMGRWNGTWGAEEEVVSSAAYSMSPLERVAKAVEGRYTCALFAKTSLTELSAMYPDESSQRQPGVPRIDGDVRPPSAESTAEGPQDLPVANADGGVSSDPPVATDLAAGIVGVAVDAVAVAEIKQGKIAAKSFVLVDGWPICPINSTSIDRGALEWADRGDTVCNAGLRHLVDECTLTHQVSDYYVNGVQRYPRSRGSVRRSLEATFLANAVLNRPNDGRAGKSTPKHSAATPLYKHVCSAHSRWATARRHPRHLCTRFPLTGISLEAMQPGTRGFEDVMLQLCRWPRAWPLCALNLGARVLCGIPPAEFRARMARVAGLSSDFAEFLCTSSASNCSSSACAEFAELRQRYDDRPHRTTSRNVTCENYLHTQTFLDSCEFGS
jgi:hypothetical protein